MHFAFFVISCSLIHQLFRTEWKIHLLHHLKLSKLGHFIDLQISSKRNHTSMQLFVKLMPRWVLALQSFVSELLCLTIHPGEFVWHWQTGIYLSTMSVHPVKSGVSMHSLNKYITDIFLSNMDIRSLSFQDLEGSVERTVLPHKVVTKISTTKTK